MSMFEMTADMYLPVAAALFLIALVFTVIACSLFAQPLALCAGLCYASAGRLAYAAARERGLLPR